jgi:hypothetical protein
MLQEANVQGSNMRSTDFAFLLIMLSLIMLSEIMQSASLISDITLKLIMFSVNAMHHD